MEYQRNSIIVYGDLTINQVRLRLTSWRYRISVITYKENAVLTGAITKIEKL